VESCPGREGNSCRRNGAAMISRGAGSEQRTSSCCSPVGDHSAALRHGVACERGQSRRLAKPSWESIALSAEWRNGPSVVPYVIQRAAGGLRASCISGMLFTAAWALNCSRRLAREIQDLPFFRPASSTLRPEHHRHRHTSGNFLRRGQCSQVLSSHRGLVSEPVLMPPSLSVEDLS
jgi:hypothetical protein